MKTNLTVILLLLTMVAGAQSLKGRVIEADAYKTPLFGATVLLLELNKGVITGLSGHFEIPNVPAGTYHVRVSFVGFHSQEIEITLPSDQLMICALEEDVQQLAGVEVKAAAIKEVQLQQASLSTIKVTDLPLTAIPRLLGEPDLIRMIQNLPGVKTETDFTGGFSVRGGRNDQNLILMEEVPIYNPWHLFGLFSAFNTEAIDQVTFTKGVFPAQFGSRASSVLDIKLQDGSERLGLGHLTVSPISASFSYGRPLNQKTSYLMAIRRTYLDPFFALVNLAGSFDDSYTERRLRNGYNFMDLNTKLVHRFSDQLRLETGVFVGNDKLKFGFDEKYKESDEIYKSRTLFGWRNITGSVKLIKETEKMRSKSHLFVSNYNAENLSREVEENSTYFYGSGGFSTSTSEIEGYLVDDAVEESVFAQRLNDWGAQQDFVFFLSGNVDLSVGAQWFYHQMREETSTTSREYGFAEDEIEIIDRFIPESYLILNKDSTDILCTSSHELGAYINSGINIGAFSLYPGLRMQYYTNGDYLDLLPRLNARLDVTKNWSVTAGYGHFAQYIQTVGLEFLRAPSERWFWPDAQRQPLRVKTWTAGVGYEHQRLGKFSVEGYYKTLDGLLSFSPKRQAEAQDTQVEFIMQFGTETLSGTGEAYGGEFLWQKTEGKLTGWMGYTLSWVWNTFDELNAGERYPSRTDKRHDIQTFWTYDFNENWSVGALFNYKTGQPITFSTGVYLVDNDPLDIGDRAGEYKVQTEMNNFRLPVYHRLDLSITWKNRRVFKRKSELSLNVVNVYNRLNVLYVNQSAGVSLLPNGKVRVIPRNNYVGQLPILPMLSLRIGLGGANKW